MGDTRADFTMTFRQLGSLSISKLSTNNIPDALWALKDLQRHSQFHDWIRVYTARAANAGKEAIPANREEQMNGVWGEGEPLFLS